MLDISPLCDHCLHTVRGAHTRRKTYMCTPIHTYTHTHTTSQTPNVLHPLLLTLAPSEPSQHPPLQSLIQALPNCPSTSFFLAMHTVQKLHFWLTRWEHKSPSYASWRSPTGEAPIPSWVERVHTDQVSPLFSHYHLHTGLSHLAFGWCVPYPPFPTTTTTTTSPPRLHSQGPS